jgi:hypothetical protein
MGPYVYSKSELYSTVQCCIDLSNQGLNFAKTLLMTQLEVELFKTMTLPKFKPLATLRYARGSPRLLQTGSSQVGTTDPERAKSLVMSNPEAAEK